MSESPSSNTDYDQLDGRELTFALYDAVDVTKQSGRPLESALAETVLEHGEKDALQELLEFEEYRLRAGQQLLEKYGSQQHYVGLVKVKCPELFQDE